MSKVIKVVTLFIGLSAVLLLAGFTNSSKSGSPLPPRPTSVPTAVAPVEIVSAPNTGSIRLHLENDVDEIPGELWTAVEWQDPNTSSWHVVEGWRGTLDAPTTQTWWVGSDQFGDGPFRWQLYADKDGKLLATSETFNLPARAGLMVVLNVTLLEKHLPVISN